MISNPEHITAIFKNPMVADEKPAQSARLQRMFGTSVKASLYWDKDDSGIGLQPRKGSQVRPEHRVHLWGTSLPKTFLAGRHLAPLNERFTALLQDQLDSYGIGQDEWVELPDLYSFIQSIIGRALTGTVMGPRLLELNPTLLDDFYAYDNNLIKLMFGWPQWLAPDVYRVRDRLRAAMAKWHAEAAREAPLDMHNPRVGPDDPELDTYYGSKLMRAQRAAMMKMGLDREDAASLDISTLFALNSNVLRLSFWLVLHTICDANLRARLLAEVERCCSSSRDASNGSCRTIDAVALAQQPRLQSVFAEVCRYYVAVALPRVVQHAPLRLAGGYAVPAGGTVVVFSRDPGFNDEAWAAAGRPQQRLLAEFDPERFLVAAQEEEQKMEDCYSMEKLSGCWLPFGGGQRMCPGRHFAKSEILVAFATLFLRYELELVGDNVRPDMRWYAIGALLPTRKVPFRIRKRA